ncbi:MAG: SET domain-containing protein-lysine N-methyltransferase [Candidatus Aenigmarchaeota archaeon]|nr:SET domain-containing protein-lysine N-methyltransferase [Candidatus Aenigmarchaeota archaeon]
MIFAKLKVRNAAGNQKGVFAAENIENGKKMLDFPGKIVPEEKSNPLDLQISKNTVIRASSKNQIDNFLNHSCDPTACVKKKGEVFYLISIKNIKKGDEITFDYDTTDYDNKEFEFSCSCKSLKCRKMIRGFKYLDARQKKKLSRYLIPYLKRIFENQKK